MPPLIILGIALWGVRVPVAKLLQPWLGVDAIWWSFPVSSVCAMLMSLAYYRWGRLAPSAHAEPTLRGQKKPWPTPGRSGRHTPCPGSVRCVNVCPHKPRTTTADTP